MKPNELKANYWFYYDDGSECVFRGVTKLTVFEDRQCQIEIDEERHLVRPGWTTMVSAPCEIVWTNAQADADPASAPEVDPEPCLETLPIVETPVETPVETNVEFLEKITEDPVDADAKLFKCP